MNNTALSDKELTAQWNAIDWPRVENSVSNLQERIARAAKEENYLETFLLYLSPMYGRGRLEPDDAKVSRPVPRRAGKGNLSPLFGDGNEEFHAVCNNVITGNKQVLIQSINTKKNRMFDSGNPCLSFLCSWFYSCQCFPVNLAVW